MPKMGTVNTRNGELAIWKKITYTQKVIYKKIREMLTGGTL